MILENRRSRILEPALASSGLSLIAGSVLCFAAAYSIHQINTAPAMNVDFSEWNWVNSVKVQVDSKPQAAQLTQGPMDPFSALVDASKPIDIYKPSPFQDPTPIRPVKQMTVAKKARHPVVVSATKKAVVHHGSQAITVVSHETRGIIPVVQQVQQAEPTSQTEAYKMQQLFGMLNNQFHVAMTIQPEMAARILALHEAEEHKAMVEADRNLSGNTQKVAANDSSDDAVADMSDDTNNDEPAAREVPHQPVVLPRHAAVQKPIQVVASADDMGPRETYGPDEETKSMGPASVDDEISISSAAEKAMSQVDSQVTTQSDDDQASASADDADQDQPQAVAEEETQEEVIPGPPPIATVNARMSNSAEITQLAKSVGYGTTTSHGNGITVAPPARAILTTQTSAPAAAPAYQPADYSVPTTTTQATQPTAVHAMATAMTTQNLMAAFSPVTTHPFALPENPIRNDGALAVEAFDWVTPIQDLSLGEVTHESTSAMEIPAGYVLAHSSEHWSTLARRPLTTLPLISMNSARLLAAVSGAALQSETGIVFGKVAAGWSVRLSGRAERAVFFNTSNQPISSQLLDGERYFAFVNVEPGAHLLYLTNSSGIEEGAVGVGAFSGISSYADLTTIGSTTVRGRVLDGSGAETAPLSKARVRVLGNSGAETTTDDSGIFQIDHVLTVGTYPVYFETDSRDGYTHRYQLKPSQLGSVTLYRLSTSAIQTWVSQLEGSLSNDGGLIVAAMPNLAASAQTALSPRVSSMVANPTLKPEIYTVAASGQLQVGVPVDEKNSRVLSVQVPEGPVIMSMESPDKKEVWSDFLISSPNVISIVGPL